MNNNSFVVIIMLREYYYIIIIVLLFLDVIVVSYEEKRHSLQFSFCAFQELDLKILSALAQKVTFRSHIKLAVELMAFTCVF